MQCFVLPHVLSTKPARWTLRPPSREHGFCCVGSAQTHAGELCASFAPAQPNGREFSGNRSGYRLVCFFLLKSGVVRSLLAVRAEPRRAPVTRRPFLRPELYHPPRHFSCFRRPCAEPVDRSDDPRARSSLATEGVPAGGESEPGAGRRGADRHA